jgi:CO/xanthine dehydrogenase FAD-binding subunit
MQTIVDSSDGDLARAVAARVPGEAESAEAELYRRFAPRVRLYGLRHLRDEDEARDLSIVLQPGELLVTLVFPPPGKHAASAYERFIPRNEMDIAVAGAGSWLQLSADGQTVEKARIGLCAIAPTPQLAEEASNWLAGQPATEDIFARAGELATQVASPITDMRGTAEYRMHLVGVLVKRTLLNAAERARS